MGEIRREGGMVGIYRNVEKWEINRGETRKGDKYMTIIIITIRNKEFSIEFKWVYTPELSY